VDCRKAAQKLLALWHPDISAISSSFIWIAITAFHIFFAIRAPDIFSGKLHRGVIVD